MASSRSEFWLACEGLGVSLYHRKTQARLNHQGIVKLCLSGGCLQILLWCNIDRLILNHALDIFYTGQTLSGHRYRLDSLRRNRINKININRLLPILDLPLEPVFFSSSPLPFHPLWLSSGIYPRLGQFPVGASPHPAIAPTSNTHVQDLAERSPIPVSGVPICSFLGLYHALAQFLDPGFALFVHRGFFAVYR